MTETITMTNPFAGSQTEISRVFDENKQSKEYVKEYLSKHTVEDENEFYVLFGEGVLMKKGRSKTRTSDYIAGEKHLNVVDYYG